MFYTYDFFQPPPFRESFAQCEKSTCKQGDLINAGVSKRSPRSVGFYDDAQNHHAKISHEQRAIRCTKTLRIFITHKRIFPGGRCGYAVCLVSRRILRTREILHCRKKPRPCSDGNNTERELSSRVRNRFCHEKRHFSHGRHEQRERIYRWCQIVLSGVPPE